MKCLLDLQRHNIHPLFRIGAQHWESSIQRRITKGTSKKKVTDAGNLKWKTENVKKKPLCRSDTTWQSRIGSCFRSRITVLRITIFIGSAQQLPLDHLDLFVNFTCKRMPMLAVYFPSHWGAYSEVHMFTL